MSTKRKKKDPVIKADAEKERKSVEYKRLRDHYQFGVLHFSTFSPAALPADAGATERVPVASPEEPSKTTKTK